MSKPPGSPGPFLGERDQTFLPGSEAGAALRPHPEHHEGEWRRQRSRTLRYRD